MRVALFNDTSGNGHFGCTAVMSTILTQGAKRGFDFVFICPTGRDWRQYKDEILQKNIDLILVNGEGTIHHTDRNERAKALCALGRFANDELSVPSVLINATLFELDEECFKLLHHFTRIFVRETESQKYLASHGIVSEWFPDLSVFSPHLVNLKNPRQGILVTDSVKRQVAKELRIFATLHDLVFEEMVNFKTRRFWGHRFIRSLIKIESRIPSPNEVISREYQPLSRFFQRICEAELVITGRFHTFMLALAAGTPVFAIDSNTPKISFVARDVLGGQSDLIIRDSILQETPPSLLAASKNQERYADDVRSYIEFGKDKMLSAFDEIVNLSRSAG